MAQLIAGEAITLHIEGITLTAKIEDASKSDIFSVKIENISPPSPHYHVGQVCEFDRKLLD